MQSNATRPLRSDKIILENKLEFLIKGRTILVYLCPFYSFIITQPLKILGSFSRKKPYGKLRNSNIFFSNPNSVLTLSFADAIIILY